MLRWCICYSKAPLDEWSDGVTYNYKDNINAEQIIWFWVSIDCAGYWYSNALLDQWTHDVRYCTAFFILTQNVQIIMKYSLGLKTQVAYMALEK